MDPCYTQQTALPEFALDDTGDTQDYEDYAKGTTGQDDPCHTPHVKTHNDTEEPASPLNKCPEDAQGSLSDTNPPGDVRDPSTLSDTDLLAYVPIRSEEISAPSRALVWTAYISVQVLEGQARGRAS